MVEKFGTLAEFDFLYHRSGPQNGQPRGYAFVTFKEPKDAIKAQKTLNGVEVLGRKIVAKWSNAQDETRYLPKPKPEPPALKLSRTEPNEKSRSKFSTIAALEAQLKCLDSTALDVAVKPDIGGPSVPTTVIYNYIEKTPKPSYTSNQRCNKFRYNSNPYDKTKPHRK